MKRGLLSAVAAIALAPVAWAETVSGTAQMSAETVQAETSLGAESGLGGLLVVLLIMLAIAAAASGSPGNANPFPV